MISGEEDESSGDEGSEKPAEQWSDIAYPPKVLGVDPTTQLEVLFEGVTTTTSLLVIMCIWVGQKVHLLGKHEGVLS